MPSARTRPFLILLALLLSTGTVDTAKAADPAPVAVQSWLVLGPFDAPFPAFNDTGKKVETADVLAYEHIRVADMKPIRGATVARIGGGTMAWSPMTADTGGVALPATGKLARVVYLAAYIDVPRWMPVDLAARGSQSFEVFIDGTSVSKQAAAPKKGAEDVKGSAKLERGKHLLVVKSVFVPADSGEATWSFRMSIAAGKDAGAEPFLGTDRSRTLVLGDVLDAPAARSSGLSPDGMYAALSISQRIPPEGKTDSRMEIRRVSDATIVRVLDDMNDAANFAWAPKGHRLSYVSTTDELATLRVIDVDSGDIVTVLKGIKDFSDYTWSPDGTFIVYSLSQKPEDDKTGVKRMRGVSDRRAKERDRSSLYATSVPGGVTRRLTAGEYTAYLYDIHPDGKSILIGRNYEDLAERPYEVTELVRLNLATAATEELWKGRWMGGAFWSPDGKKILVTGGPSTFGKVGENVAGDAIANGYDTQAFLLDPVTKAVDPITRAFDPAIHSVYWPKPGNEIYLVAEQGDHVRLYRYVVGARSFREIKMGCEVVGGGSVAADKPVGIFSGSGASKHDALFAVDLQSGKARAFMDPAAAWFAEVKPGRVEVWNFSVDGGREITGRIYYPPDFDAAKKYPGIVYYYGGTSPVDRGFGGRYPKELWAAAGYVVYVPQPSGATGFGQEFSARHVNDWGKTTANEVIAGTKKFLAAHAFVDPKRVGCIGASYGGFLTELIVTRTDIFAAAVSHAGISDISSYWGEGYWGYQYNSISAANSFPWNRRDLYIEQSPLFAADKVHTPLLLLHGGADTNVPRGESDQMYAALKLLGREVEYLQVEGQDHWILDYKKRIVWSNAIVAWFDRWLKDQPQWWNDMYPALDQKADEKK